MPHIFPPGKPVRLSPLGLKRVKLRQPMSGVVLGEDGIVARVKLDSKDGQGSVRPFLVQFLEIIPDGERGD